MTNLRDVCEDVVKTTPGALSFTVIDLHTAKMLASVHTVSAFTQRYLEALAFAAVDMFRGSGVTLVESLEAEQNGAEAVRSVMEVQITKVDSFQFMLIPERYPDILIMLTTNRDTTLGAGWIAMRGARERIEQVLG